MENMDNACDLTKIANILGQNSGNFESFQNTWKAQGNVECGIIPNKNVFQANKFFFLELFREKFENTMEISGS